MYTRFLGVTFLIAVLVMSFLACNDDDDNPVSSQPAFPFVLSEITTKPVDWKMASTPAQLDPSAKRGKLLWHTPRDLTAVDEIFNLEISSGQGAIPTLRLIFRPHVLDTTWSWQVNGPDSTPIPDISSYDGKSWAGMTCWLQPYLDRLTDSVNYFDIRARSNSGIVQIEFGMISEDINNDAFAYTEGIVGVPFTMEQDIGFDGLADSDEPFYHPLVNPDPSGDNWYFQGEGKCPFPVTLCDDPAFQDSIWQNDSIYYEFLNGTEGNNLNPVVPVTRDKEPFNGTFYTANSYLGYSIDLNDPNQQFLLDDRSHLPGVYPPWQTFRIPFRDTTLYDYVINESGVGEPDWNIHETMTHMRIWFESRTGQTTPDTLEIALMFFRTPGE